MKRVRPAGSAGRSGWTRALSVLPGAGLTLLPIGTCPACWPVYAGVLSSLGLGFLLSSAYLLPATVAFLAFALGTLAYGARSRRGYAPFAVGVLASTLALFGKFGLSSDPVLYAGLALLVGASIWNAWPRKAATTGCRGTCAAAGSTDPIHRAHTTER